MSLSHCFLYESTEKFKLNITHKRLDQLYNTFHIILFVFVSTDTHFSESSESSNVDTIFIKISVVVIDGFVEPLLGQIMIALLHFTQTQFEDCLNGN